MTIPQPQPVTPSRDPALRAMRDACARCGEVLSFATFTRELHAPFAALVASGLAGRQIAHLVRGMAENAAMALPPLWLSDRQVGGALFDGFEPLRVVLAEDPRGRASRLHGSPRHRLIGVVAGTITCRRFVHDGPRDPAVLDRTARLTAMPPATMRPGNTIALEAWREVAELSGRGLLLTLESPIRDACYWRYDPQTLEPTDLQPSEPRWRRLEAALDMLRRIGEPDHAEACSRFVRHLSPTVRRQAVRAVHALEHPERTRLVREACDDPDPDVRQLAAAVAEAS